MTRRTYYRRIGCLVLLAALTGCHEPASKLSQANLDEPSKVKSAAASYWEHEPPNRPTTGYRKVALVEFAIEYVTEKLESLSDNQPGVVIHEFIPIGFATSMAGAGRIRIQLDEAMRKEFPDELHRFFVDRLEAEGMKLVPSEAIRASKAYGNLRIEKPGYRDLGHAFNVAGTDVGVPRLLVVEPATGFDVIVGTNDFRTVEQVEQDIIKEVGADVALRVRFRLSVYRQYASMEKWSILRVTKSDTFGYHFAERSLVSDETVVKKEEFLPVAGIIKQIDTDQYRLAIKKLYPPFLNMAVHTLVGQSDISESTPVDDAS